MSTTTHPDPETLEQEFWNIAERTRTDGTVEARVEAIEPASSNRVTVTVTLPNGRETSYTFGKPVSDTNDERFVRFVRYNGYTLSTATEMVGETIEYTAIETSAGSGAKWEPVIPSKTVPRRERFAEWAVTHIERFIDGTASTFLAGATCVIFAPLVFPFFMHFVYKANQDGYGDAIIPTLFMTFILFCGSALFWLFFALLEGSLFGVIFDVSTLPNGNTAIDWAVTW